MILADIFLNDWLLARRRSWPSFSQSRTNLIPQISPDVRAEAYQYQRRVAEVLLEKSRVREIAVTAIGPKVDLDGYGPATRWGLLLDVLVAVRSNFSHF